MGTSTFLTRSTPFPSTPTRCRCAPRRWSCSLSLSIYIVLD
jgi:hypothetical protein